MSQRLFNDFNGIPLDMHDIGDAPRKPEWISSAPRTKQSHIHQSDSKEERRENVAFRSEQSAKDQPPIFKEPQYVEGLDRYYDRYAYSYSIMLLIFLI